MALSPVILGYVSQLRPNYKERLLAMAPDGRLAKPNPERDTPDQIAAKQAALDASVAAKWNKFETESGLSYRQTAFLSEIVAVDVRHKRVFEKRCDRPGVVSSAFYEWLSEKHRFPWTPVGQDNTHTALIYGFDVKSFLGVLYLDCVRQGHSIPIGLWYRNDGAIDPLSALVDSSLSDMVQLPKVFQDLGLRCAEDYTMHKSAVDDAVLTMELCARLGLVTDKIAIDLETAGKREPQLIESEEQELVDEAA